MKKNKFRWLVGTMFLAANLALTSCGASKIDDENIITEEETNLDSSAMENAISQTVEAMVDITRESIENMDEFTEERAAFARLVDHHELLYTDEFKAIDDIYINWNSASNMYEIEAVVGDNKFELRLLDSELINFIIHQTSCKTLTIDHDKDEQLLTSLTACDTINTIVINDSNITSLDGLNNLTNLEEISISYCDKLTDISALENLSNLKNIAINGTSISDISTLSKLPNLTYLNLRCNEITNPEVLNDLENLTNLSLEFNRIENREQLNVLVEKGLFTSEHADSIIESSETQRLSFAVDNYQEKATVLFITFLDSKQSYFVELRNDDGEIVKYAMTSDPFDFYNLTKDTPNCTGIKLTNIPEDFHSVSIAEANKFDAMVIDHSDINNLYFVSDFKNLTYLSIENCPNLKDDALDWGPFSIHSLKNLKNLIIKGTSIADFSSLIHFSELEGLELQNNNITDYNFLVDLPNLNLAIIGIDNYPIDTKPIETIQENGVKVRIEGYYLPEPDTLDNEETIDSEKVFGLTPEN